MSKIQDVPFITKVIDTLSDELKSGLYDLIDGQVKTPVFRSLVNNDYAITEANDKGKVQFVTLETLRGNYTGYLAYNSVYCVLIAFKGNTQALDMLNINVAKHTFAFVNESLSILELRVELEDGKEGVTPTDLGVTNNNIHLAKGTTQIGEGVNLKTLDGNTLIGSGNVGFKTINDQEIVGDGNIVVGEGGTITIDTALSDSSTNPVQNKVVTEEFNKYKSLSENYAVNIQFEDTSANILALTSDNGAGLGTDTGHWYYWNGTQYVDGGVYQATSLSNENITQLLKVKNLVNGNNIFESDLLTGKYYETNGQLVDNASSKYLDSIDLTNFVGGYVKIVTANGLTAGSPRNIVFKNHNDTIVKIYSEENLKNNYEFRNDNGNYEVNIPILYNYKTIFFSISTYAGLISLSINRNDVIKKDIVDVVNDNKVAVKIGFSDIQGIRIYSFPTLVSMLKAKTITIENIPDNIGVSLFYRESSTETINVNNTGWNYIKNYTHDVSFMYDFSIYYRKLDNTSFTQQEINFILENVKIYSTIENKSEGVFVDGVNGDDNNIGSKALPFKTITKAINSGKKNIFIKPGNYNETITISNKNDITIEPYGLPTFGSETPETPLIHLDGGNEKTITNGILINNCSNIVIENVWCDNTSGDGAYLTNCNNIVMNNCKFTNTFFNGLRLVNVNGVFNNCVAYSIGDESLVHADGFNIHGYGCTTFNNCVAYNCLDDGISHHDGCTGYINGGEFYNCGKGGVSSPTHGSLINICGVYCHDNTYGLYADEESVARTGNILITNSVFINNTNLDIICNYYTLNLLNCKYNKAGGTGTVNNLNI